MAFRNIVSPGAALDAARCAVADALEALLDRGHFYSDDRGRRFNMSLTEEQLERATRALEGFRSARSRLRRKIT